MSYRWCLSKPNVNPIVGLSSVERINQAVEAVKFASDGGLTEEDIKYLEEPYTSRVCCLTPLISRKPPSRLQCLYDMIC